MALICHCRLVSDRRVLAEIEAGACSLAEVQERCGAATRCGGCRPAVELLVERAGDQLLAIPA
jgi:bacterioferritin-associated ferredoxin